MALRLRIISDHRRHLGDRSTKVFGPAGGTIGRSADNDWVLPDPQRYVSAHHARVRCQNGHYYLEDLSTNGVYVNDEPQPIGKRRTYRLRHGDVLRFGEYQIVVTLEAEEPPVFDDSGSIPAVPTSIQVLRGLGLAAQTDIGASLNLEQLLITESPPGDDFQVVDAYGQSVALTAPSAVAARPAPAARSEPDDEAVARRLARLARAAGAASRESTSTRTNGTSTSGVHDVRSGLQAFCRGAGIDADQFPVDAQARLLHLAGQLLRESLLGLKDLERARDGIRSRFGLGPSSDPDDPRPSLARSAIDELLTEIFRQHESRRLDAVQWLREALANARSHEEAVIQAMRSAFVDFIGRLDPAELEARFDRAKRTGEPVQYWDLYGDLYRNLTEMPADHLPHTFVEAFANAYLEWLRKPSQ